ncbi:MAG: hypothetical protein HYZ14_10330 [Bacteroidetes bacterium]|nr:hypothetical protein [Bacteroidota bacterium]
MGTVLVHVFIFIYANFVTIKRPYALVEPQVEMDIPLDDIPLDPEMMKLLEIKQNQGQDQNQQVYNVTSDANDTRDKSYEDFSTQEIDQQVLENTKALEQQYFNEWESTHGGNGGQKNENSSMDIQDRNEQVNKQNSNTTDKSIDTQGSNSFAGDVMASFNLKDRKAHALEKPGYTCNTAGTVTLEIKVGKDGDVQNVTYLPGASSNATDCMIQQSIKYAKRSRFNYSSTAPAIQTGTITYKFVSR